jgi:hypothetical protein
VIPTPRLPTIAERYLELKALAWPETDLRILRGRELRFIFKVAPTPLSRVYRCLLKVYARGGPDLIVLDPNPKSLAAGTRVPHTYPHDGAGTKLCLWLPEAREWMPQMRLNETYLPWAAEWLDYFEEWLVTGDWAGDGVHPDGAAKRWARPRATRAV